MSGLEGKLTAVIDSGTSNTRIYIARGYGDILASRQFACGGKDVSTGGSAATLKQALEENYRVLLTDHGLSCADIAYITASGMITSDVGLIELPHLKAPAGVEELAGGIRPIADPEVLDLGAPVYFIRGVANAAADGSGAVSLMDADFMRGEEIQYPGIMEELGLSGPCVIITLSSHTKFCYMDAAGRISYSKTTLSGQVYAALKEQTMLAKSLAQSPTDGADALDKELVDSAFRCVQSAGLLHALMGPRFMQVLAGCKDPGLRNLYLDAAIAADDLNAYRYMRTLGKAAPKVVIYGQRQRCRIYGYLLQMYFGAGSVAIISDEARIARCSVIGAQRILCEYLKQCNASA